MNARERPLVALRAMMARDLDAVQAIEASAYVHPWSQRNFIDSLVAEYLAEVLELDGAPAGYFIAMVGFDELHLLNVTVKPACQGQGLGHLLLDVVQAHGRRLGLAALLLEVRRSNERARALYLRRGFAQIGERRAYYPAQQGREDAIIMKLNLAPDSGSAHGLV